MSNRKKFAAAVLVLCLLAAALLIFLGVSELQDRKAGHDYYAGLVNIAVPTVAPVPVTTVPATTPASAASVPEATETPATPPSAATSSPATPVPTATPAPATPVPTATPAPATPVPTATPAPATPVPTATPAPTTPVPTATAVPETPSPTATRVVITLIPMVTPTPTQSATPAPATSVPTATPAPATPIPTATPAPATPVPTATATPTASVSRSLIPNSPTPTATPAPASAMDFDALRQVLPDVVGWIVIEGTNINYPIVQGVDNDFYLKHLPDGTANRSGSIMLDVENLPDWSDDLNVVHGHRMRTGDMFGNLHYFGNADYAQEHLNMILYTPGGDYRIELIAACTVDGRKLGFPANFRDDAAFNAYVGTLVRNSAYEAGWTPEREDRLILLSTCAYVYDNARFVLLGRLTPLTAEDFPAE